jgi:hypothetical protein
MKFSFIVHIAFIFSIFCGYSQELTWTGNANNADFFDEQNWVDNETNSVPTAGTLNPNSAINFNLNITDASVSIQANGTISLANVSLTIQNSELDATSISGGEFILNTDAYLNLTASDALQNNVAINFNSPNAWVKVLELPSNTVFNNHLSQFSVQQNPAAHQSNLRLDNYYHKGTIIRSIDTAENPLQVFSNENLQGNSADISLDIIHSANEISNNLNNNITSFVLKRGHMVTFAVEDDGTGKSKNYIASEEDLIINELPGYLNNEISFIRVMPWNWATKKGRGGGGLSTLIGNSWFYHWNNTMDSTLELEYAPMSWGTNGANDDGDILNYRSKYKSTHVLAFNESDNCNDQSGQYNNLCQVDVAVGYYENLMKTGMRLVSPNCREHAPFGWLKDFYDLATEQDIRIDVIGVHWYDWGSNPTNSPNANATDVFNRFVTYLDDVHELYGLPIWITEFNANINRTNQVNYEFMQLALPYLESLDYVERYAWFEPFSGVADYVDSSGNFTNVGTFISNFESTPAIPENTLSDNNNIDNFINSIDPTGENLIYNGFFETNDLSGWEGTNLGVLTNNNSNIYNGTTSGRILANEGQLYQDIEIDPNGIYEVSFFTKWFVPPSNPIEVKVLNTADNTVIVSQLMGTSTTWNEIQFEFTTPNDVSEIQFIVEKGNEPGWFIDDAVMLKTGTLSVNQFANDTQLKIYPNPSSEVFTLVCSESMQIIHIYNLQGRLMKKVDAANQNETKINVSNLTSGIYLLNINTKSGNSLSKKILIQ